MDEIDEHEDDELVALGERELLDALGAAARQFESEAALEDKLGELAISGEWGRQYRRREVDERGAEHLVVTNTGVDGTPRVVYRYGGGIDPAALT
jgi:hypothetical protein